MFALQRLVTFQAAIDLVNYRPQALWLHLSANLAHRIRAWKPLAKPSLPEAGAGRVLQTIQTPYPGPKQHQPGLYHRRGRNPWHLASVRYPYNRLPQGKYLVAVPDNPSENGLSPFSA